MQCCKEKLAIFPQRLIKGLKPPCHQQTGTREIGKEENRIHRASRHHQQAGKPGRPGSILSPAVAHFHAGTALCPTPHARPPRSPVRLEPRDLGAVPSGRVRLLL